jgi:hypothetical protein
VLSADFGGMTPCVDAVFDASDEHAALAASPDFGQEGLATGLGGVPFDVQAAAGAEVPEAVGHPGLVFDGVAVGEAEFAVFGAAGRGDKTVRSSEP